MCITSTRWNSNLLRLLGTLCTLNDSELDILQPVTISIGLVFSQHSVSYSSSTKSHCRPQLMQRPFAPPSPVRSFARWCLRSAGLWPSVRPFQPSDAALLAARVSLPCPEPSSPPLFHSVPHPPILVCFFIKRFCSIAPETKSVSQSVSQSVG